MSEQPVLQVSRATAARDASGALPQEALKQRELTFMNDGEIVFTGDGAISPADVMARVLERIAAQDPELESFRESRGAAIKMAEKSLELYNPQLERQSPTGAVPSDRQFFSRLEPQEGVATKATNDLKRWTLASDLKAMLKPWVGRLGELEAAVAASETALGGGSSEVTGHKVYSQGRTLGGAGEPEAVPDMAMLKRLIPPK